LCIKGRDVVRLLIKLTCILALSVLLVSVFSSYYQMQRNKMSLRRELQKRAEVLAESLQDTIARARGTGSAAALQRTVNRFGNRENLIGIAVYGEADKPIAITASLASKLSERPPIVTKAAQDNAGLGQFARLVGEPVHIYAVPLHDGEKSGATLLVVHDAGYITAMSVRAWQEMSFRVLFQIGLILLFTLIIFQRAFLRPIARTTAWMRDIRNGRTPATPAPVSEMLLPLTREASTFARTLHAAKASAEKEAQLRIRAESSWTAERLAVCLHGKLEGSRLFVVANREPYMHMRNGRTVETIVPASGLVTALEPVLCACDGTWVAHGSGNADREFVDARNRVRVPPDDPRYTLRRVWLSKEEEDGYYFGFANEGLWPLCHIVHARPTFRAADWEQYKKVNAKFADALVAEMAETEHPVVVVQDYHFAVLPQMIKERRPDARVGIFWHIPWPNPEAFGICPWQRELLEGLLGADLIGFHVQYHCDHFLETVNRAIESRVEWERFAVNRGGHVTIVRPFPISVVFSEPEKTKETPFHIHQAQLLRELGSDALYVGLGVDRVDYTKGILERFRAVERFLQKYPQYQGRFTFIQIGAPSRTNIKRYDDFMREVVAEAERVNRTLQTANWRPIILRNFHHTHAEVEQFYRAADVCLVTSLHDGMNLVAKEYLRARHDGDGVLVLSPFTGAARELPDALIVNPYDTEALADSIFRALEMEPSERALRMRRMRAVVKEQNVYRWAGNLISELCDVRLETTRKKLASAAAARTPDEVVGEQLVHDLEHARAVSAASDQMSA
jgi:trehalose 6-phosphate synthase